MRARYGEVAKPVGSVSGRPRVSKLRNSGSQLICAQNNSLKGLCAFLGFFGGVKRLGDFVL
ncbi:MAG: hypothetical protein J6I53_10460 [Treponema sp.]|nr:hypothetical protein [Treponema sp.]